MPAILHLRPPDYRVMRWKNGLGTTTEIAVHPEGAGIDAFVWRVSMADLGASGPFSSFPGYERILIQTEGAPMTLSHEGRGRRRLALLEPYRFDGAWVTRGELEAPPARDFNVMVRRDLMTAQASVHRLAHGETVRGVSGATTQILHALRGGVAVVVAPAGPRAEPEALAEGDTLVVTGEASLALTSTSGDATVFVVALALS